MRTYPLKGGSRFVEAGWYRVEIDDKEADLVSITDKETLQALTSLIPRPSHIVNVHQPMTVDYMVSYDHSNKE